jgi:formylglycine-generating enzyme required for sulfatase activity
MKAGRTHISRSFALFFWASAFVACDRPEAGKAGPRSGPEAAPPQAALATNESTAPAAPTSTCPDGLAPIPGGAFAVGSITATYEGEENPRFWTQLAPFCADPTEVTARIYQKCVEAGRCTPSQDHGKRCTLGAQGKEDHPINCITYAQATEVCSFRGLRLPSEVEWEYLARGGAEMRKYPWGDAPPDDQTCWKHHETCQVKTFAPGAFGLWDVTGNVWEWTSSWFSPYPWPSALGRHRVYRGGSWSRRFEKWLKPTLRNRASPESSGSHLGVRCVADQAGALCPYGRAAPVLGPDGAEVRATSACAFGVDRVECALGLEWNGLRCAAPGEARCPPGTSEVPGRGCVREARATGAAAPRGSNPGELDLSLVSRQRSPEFDADCAKNQPSRPISFRYAGGEHLGRNQVMTRAGCKNRDVGVGWNSGCCPTP